MDRQRGNSAASSIRSCKRTGLSLIELLIVLVLLGLAASMIAPRLEPSYHTQLCAAADVIAADLTYARSLAVANNSHYTVAFDPDAQAYSISHTGVDNSLDRMPPSPYHEYDEANHRLIAALENMPELGTAVRIVRVDGPATIEFTPLGATQSARPSRIWLACGHSDAQLAIAISVDSATGGAEIGSVQSGNAWDNAESIDAGGSEDLQSSSSGESVGGGL